MVCLNTSLMPAEPKARSFWSAWMTVKTWHCPCCHLVKTKKPKEVFLSFVHSRKAIFLIADACLLAPSIWSNSDEMLCLHYYGLCWIANVAQKPHWQGIRWDIFCIFQLVLFYCLHVLVHLKHTDLFFLSYSSTLFFIPCTIFAGGHSLIGKTVVSGKLLSFPTF